MGVFCEINLHKPINGVYTPGSSVFGAVKYVVDKETKCKGIIVSLKGMGYVLVTEHITVYNGKRMQRRSITHTNRETYIDNDQIVLTNTDDSINIHVGFYEVPFHFVLPTNIPASYEIVKSVQGCSVRCKIQYYIRMKFEFGFMRFSKRFKKELTVVSGIIPVLPVEPTIYVQQKTLTQWFRSKSSVINIKATIQKSVLSLGDKIIFDYEVNNDTNVMIKSIETMLIEVTTFITSRTVQRVKDVKQTDSKTGSVKRGLSQALTVDINLPSHVNTIEHSKIVKREYFVRITTALPIPHSNVILDIPVQIGDKLFDLTPSQYGEAAVSDDNDSPPSYWEAMAEDNEKFDEGKT